MCNANENGNLLSEFCQIQSPVGVPVRYGHVACLDSIIYEYVAVYTFNTLQFTHK